LTTLGLGLWLAHCSPRTPGVRDDCASIFVIVLGAIYKHIYVE